MGEVGEIIEFYSGNNTHLFWNVDDYPVPVDTDLKTINRNIRDALHQMGFLGSDEYINVYSNQPKHDRKLFQAESILYLPSCPFVSKESVADMTFFMILLTEAIEQARPNVAVIVKPNSDPNSELHRVLHCLKSRGHNVLLVELPPDEEGLFSVESLVSNSRLLGGGKPRAKKELTLEDMRVDNDFEYDEMDLDDGVDVSNLSNKIFDFSEPIKHARGMKRTLIFWDAVDCPFPPSFTPDQLFEKVKTVLPERGFGDNLTIWAYDDKKWSPDTCLRDKTWDSRIFFLPGGGDKASRRVRMLNDMYLEGRETPIVPRGNLILISYHFSDDPYYMELFQNMSNRSYNLWLATPSKRRIILESPDDWPRSVFGLGARKSSEEPLPKKPKLVDAA